MWCSELDREVDPLEIEQASRNLRALNIAEKLIKDGTELLCWVTSSDRWRDDIAEFHERTIDEIDDIASCIRVELEIICNLEE